MDIQSHYGIQFEMGSPCENLIVILLTKNQPANFSDLVSPQNHNLFSEKYVKNM